MKVEDLIKNLKECDPNMEVMMWDNDNGYHYAIEMEKTLVHRNLDDELETIIEIHEK